MENEKTSVPALKDDSLAFQIFDSLDDEQIIEEIHQRAVTTWVYHFPQKVGGDVWGLSKKGVDQALEHLERRGLVFEEDTVKCEPDPTSPEHLLFFAKVFKYRYDNQLNKVSLGTLTGYKRQWVKMQYRDGRATIDPFWFEKGAAKALRNAKARAIPLEVEAEIIALAKKEGKVKEAKSEDKSLPQAQVDGDSEEGLSSKHKFRLSKIFAQHKQLGFDTKGKVKANIANLMKLTTNFSLSAFVADDKLYNEYQDLMDLKLSEKA